MGDDRDEGIDLMPDPCDFCPAADCDTDDHTDVCPNANAWQYLDDIPHFLEQHTTSELHQIRFALNNIERAMTILHRFTEESQLYNIHDAIGTIWDNSRDLAFDELFAADIPNYTTGDRMKGTDADD